MGRQVSEVFLLLDFHCFSLTNIVIFLNSHELNDNICWRLREFQVAEGDAAGSRY